MRIIDNPFYLLDVKATDDVDTIDNKAEDKAFMDEDNACKYENARIVLTSPNRRLDAEIRWFYNDCSKILKSIKQHKHINDSGLSFREKFIYYLDKLYDIDRDYFDNTYDYDGAIASVVSIIKVIDNSYRWMLDEDEIDFLLSNIDDARESAGISLVNDSCFVKESLLKLLDDSREALTCFMKKNDFRDIAKIVNIIAEEKIRSNIGAKNKKYSDVIEQMIIIYSDGIIKNELTSFQSKIFNLMEEAKDYNLESDLKELSDMVKVFDYYAQLIQLFLQDTGNSEKQSESNEIADGLRNLALYYSNEKGLSNLSKIINELIIEVFPELPNILALAQNDREHIDEIISFSKVKDAVTLVIEDLDDNIVLEQNSVAENQNYILANCCRWLQILDNTVNTVNVSVSEDKEDKYYLIAIAYLRLSSACTWGNFWQWALDYCLKGKKYAILANDKKLIDQFLADEKSYRDNLQIEAQEEAEKEAERKAMNYCASWGCNNEQSIYINVDEIRYKNGVTDYSIEFNDIEHVLMGSKIVERIIGDDYIQYILIMYTDKQCQYGMTLNIDNNSEVFNEILKRVWKSVGDKLMNNMLARLARGENIQFGNMHINDSGVWVNTSYGQHLYYWRELLVNMYQGDIIVYKKMDKTELDRVDLANVVDGRIAYIIMQIATEKRLDKISNEI